MAKLIIIRGPQQSGKTTTSGLVYKELVNLANTKKHTFNSNIVEKDSLIIDQNGVIIDFTAIFNYNNKTIGIISAGDIANNTRNLLNDFLSINIDIIICCARSRNVKGSVYRMIIEEFTSENTIVMEVSIIFSPNITEKYTVKKVIVDKIIKKIKTIVQSN